MVHNRIVRALTLAALVFAVALGALPAPAAAQSGPPTFTVVARPFCGGTVWGFGSTATEAMNNAVAEAKSNYFIFSTSVLESRCDTIQVPDPTPLDPFHTVSQTICSVKLSVCGIRKAVFIP